MLPSSAPRTATTRIAASLGLITVLGPAAIDMYLPSIPDMAVDLGTSYARMQLSLTVFLVAMGAGQLAFGPVIDAFGRKPPLLIGIAVFVATAVWSSAAQSLEMLLCARFLQGLAASLTLVVAMSSVRDVASGVRAAQVFALLMAIQGLAPILAPALGGVVAAQFGWRAVLVTLALIGVVVFLNSAISLPETLATEKRMPLRPRRVLATYGGIVADPAFLLPAAAIGAIFFFLFAYVGGAAYAYQTGYALSPDRFGFVFGGTGIAMLLGALGSGRLVTRFRVETLAVWGGALMLAGAGIALGAELTGMGLTGIVAGMAVAMLGLGIAEATVISMAMASRDENVGSSVAVLGAFQLVSASVATPLAAAFAERSTGSWLAFLGVVGILALVLVLASARSSRRSGRVVSLQH